MSSILSVQQQMLGQMEQAKHQMHTPVIRQAAVFDQPVRGGISVAFNQVMREVDAQQHLASNAMAAVDSGQSDDLVGAIIKSRRPMLNSVPCCKCATNLPRLSMM